MGSTSVGNLLVLLVIIVLTKDTRAGAYFEFRFIRYTETGCRDIYRYCDPKFRFCLDRPRRTTYSASPCYYANSGQSGYYQDANVIDFSTTTNIKGIPNPWVVYANKIMDDSFLFVTEVYDKDIFFDDHMQTWGVILKERVYPSKDESHWTYRTMASGNYWLSFEVRVYCEANYYTSDCSKYCKASDSLFGHYTCEKITGNKICMRGWTGPACTVDIDECSLNFCQRGRCDNLPGDYVCHCPPYYSGKNCTIGNNPCEARPCNNNATCTRTGEESFQCLCGKGWEGDTCETRKSSCKSMPCQNNMRCIDSADNSSYICDCQYPTTGVNCESKIPADQTNRNETAGSLNGTSETC